MKLLTRQEFKDRIFARDNGKCVVCGTQAVDAHHIIDRKCFPDGGYYLENGVSVCSQCHWDAECGTKSCEELRAAADITTIVLPPGYDTTLVYDKWGKTVSPR